MAGDERREKALVAIRVARGAIIATAAKWQASGLVDTSPLVEPLTAIQEALTALEASGRRRARRRRRAGGRSESRLRHPPAKEVAPDAAADGSCQRDEPQLNGELRREFTGLRVTAAAIETERDPERTLTWVTLLEQSADRCLAALDRVLGPDVVPTAADASTGHVPPAHSYSHDTGNEVTRVVFNPSARPLPAQ